MKSMIATALVFVAVCAIAGCAGQTLGAVEVPKEYSTEECQSYAEAAAALVEERNQGGDRGSMQRVLAGVGPEESRRDLLALIDYVWSASGVVVWSAPQQAKAQLEQQCVGRKSSMEIGARID